MILVGNQRGGARDLARHLLKDENDHVQIHEIRGFASETLDGAFNEAYAVSHGTRCKQFLFSLSLNPPQNERVSTEAFERAIEQAEVKLGLGGQPRVVVFHEKEGRRHAHAVWSRINADEMKAVQLSHTKNKLMEISREIYREHGWRMPDGMTDRSQRDPKNFTLEEWQQTKRTGKDIKSIKTALQDAWAISDSKTALEHALAERGYMLAKGDRRGYLVVDHRGEPYALNKYAGVKTKDVRARIGDADQLPTLEEANARIAEGMIPAMDRMKAEIADEERKRREDQARKRAELVERQRAQRQEQRDRMRARQEVETIKRQERFQAGFSGIWDRLTGEHKRVQERNQFEAWQAQKRDQALRDQLIFRHLEERRRIDTERARVQAQEAQRLRDIEADKKRFEDTASQERDARRQAFIEQRRQQEQTQAQTRNRGSPDISR
ncbi:relaxase/mobilization nuclease domain-containing protein [Oceanicaulis alexandrii]|uniref:relaxase/mobilization nuclease domain-containing protein n=1 Tax=Oceanicaulis alexandrii TaxID=153233 RepID=UPI003B50D3B2